MGAMCRQLFFIACCFSAALWSQNAAALEISAMSPSTAEPGTRVALTGGPFSTTAEVLLGSEVLRAEATEQSRLVFVVPELTEGDYLVLVRDGDLLSPQNFTLRVAAPAPWISSLDPARLEECSEDTERLVTISGHGFAPGAQVLVNQAAVPSRSVSPEQIVFTFPLVTSGLHRVQVANPSSKQSLPHTLHVSSVPEITSAIMGTDQINQYELIISGRNFQFNSRLLVDGQIIRDLGGMRPGAEYVQVIDCRTLRYIRYPVTREPRSVSLQVVNPDGAQSPVFQVSIP
jgi:hypothetical protein